MTVWGGFGACTAGCGGGHQERRREVASPAIAGGAACPALAGARVCGETPCGEELQAAFLHHFGGSAHPTAPSSPVSSFPGAVRMYG